MFAMNWHRLVSRAGLQARKRRRERPRNLGAGWRKPTVESLENRQMLSGDSILPAIISSGGTPTGYTSPTGYSPAQINGAYGSGSIVLGSVTGNGAGQTIAIVDPDPYITTDFSGSTQNDLYEFNNQYSLPQFNGSGLPTFTKTEVGSGVTASVNSSQEISMDVEWVHALAPDANIDLFEFASSSSLSTTLDNALTAILTADDTSGVSVVSMSFGADETAWATAAGESITSIDSTYFSTPGITYVASSGDLGPLQLRNATTLLHARGVISGFVSERSWCRRHDAEPQRKQLVQRGCVERYDSWVLRCRLCNGRRHKRR
jgi:hypothetical protein